MNICMEKIRGFDRVTASVGRNLLAPLLFFDCREYLFFVAKSGMIKSVFMIKIIKYFIKEEDLLGKFNL